MELTDRLIAGLYSALTIDLILYGSVGVTLIFFYILSALAFILVLVLIVQQLVWLNALVKAED